MSKFVFVLTIALYVSPSMAAEMYGLFMVVKGDIRVETIDKKITSAKVGTKIKPTETIISGADSRAKIVMSDRNVINISPNTKLVIEKYDSNPATGERNVEMKLLDGKVRNNVEQKYDGDKAKFTLKTPTAVAGIRGTEFLTSFNAQTSQTTIVTFKGAVAVTAPSGGTPTMVTRGQSTEVSEGKAPDAPKAIPEQELKKMDKESSSTTAPKETAPTTEPTKPQDKKDGDDSKKSDPAGTAPTGDSKSPSTSEPEKKDSAKSGSKGDNKRMPSSEGEKPPGDKPASPSMIDSADMNPDTAKAMPPPPGLPPPPVVPPPSYTQPTVIPKSPDQVPVSLPTKTNLKITITPN